MALYLDEDMVGSDANLIAFPHLLLCMGVVVVLADGALVGAHFTQPRTEQAILSEMRNRIINSGQTMAELHCAANLAEHVGTHGGLDINGKAAGLGFRGDGFIFDFGYLNPTDGAYVQVTSKGAGERPSVRFRMNEHMTYTGGQGAAIRRVTVGHGNAAPRASQRASWTINATVTDGQDLLAPFMKPVTIT